MPNQNALIAASYDDAPYLSMAFEFCAPEHLRSIAWLFGLDAPDPATARVLELGCASGGNLIPIAQRHPAAQALGVDLSATQVAAGNALIQRLGLDNVRLQQADLATLGPELGRFDYIVCHGVYSWVPASVREAILRICRDHLSPQGVAIVSYNTYPGWRMREVVRDAMRFHGAPRGGPAEQLAHGRGMLDFLAKQVAPDSMMGRALALYREQVDNGDDYYLIHEYLELHNAPCYFKEFAEAAGRQGLAYLAEAQVSSMFVSNLDAETAQALRNVCPDQDTLEQYLDFMQERQFRKTLLVHAARAGQINRTLDPARLRALSYTGRFLAPQPVPDKPGSTSFLTRRGARLELRGELTLAVAAALTAAYPNALDGAALVAGLRRNGLGAGVDLEAEVGAVLGRLLSFGGVEFQRAPWPQVPATVPAQPRLWAPAMAWHAQRFAAADAPRWRWVVAPHHETVRLDVAADHLLPLLDGTHTQAQLVAALLAADAAGTLTLTRSGEPTPITDAGMREQCARDLVARTLENLRQQRLLVA